MGGGSCHVRVHGFQRDEEESNLVLLPPYYRLRPQDAADAQLFCQDAYVFEHHCTYGRDGARLAEPVKVLGFYYRLNNGREIILQNLDNIRMSPKHRKLEIRYQYGKNKKYLSKQFRCDSTRTRDKLYDELRDQLYALTSTEQRRRRTKRSTAP